MLRAQAVTAPSCASLDPPRSSTAALPWLQEEEEEARVTPTTPMAIAMTANPAVLTLLVHLLLATNMETAYHPQVRVLCLWSQGVMCRLCSSYLSDLNFFSF